MVWSVAVVHLRNGSYGLIEIKLGGDKLIAEGVKTLTALSDKIDSTSGKTLMFWGRYLRCLMKASSLANEGIFKSQ